MKKIYLAQTFFILFIFFLTPQGILEAANISFTGEPKATVNTPYSIGIVLSGGEKTLGTDSVILYDPSMLKATSVTQGTLYPTYNPSANGRINLEKGKIILSGSTGFNNPVGATGVFSKITFTPIKKGKTLIRFDYAKGDTTKTGVIDFSGKDLLSAMPKPLAITIENESPIEIVWRYMTKAFSFLKK